MSPHEIKQKRGRRKLFLRRWHRRFGLLASIFLLIITITGIILNHFHIFSLHEKYVEQHWLLDWYSIKKPETIMCLNDADLKLCSVGKFIFHVENNDIRILENNSQKIVSLTKYNNERYLATDKNILLYTKEYQLIEQMNFSEETQEIILSVVFNENGLLINSTNDTIQLDFDSFELNSISSDNIPLSHEYTQLPILESNPEILHLTGNKFRQQQITWLKLIQDLHSGQILGFQGKLLNDIIGIILILLAISGIILWKRKKVTT